jgi:hypothetical protein
MLKLFRLCSLARPVERIWSCTAFPCWNSLMTLGKPVGVTILTTEMLGNDKAVAQPTLTRIGYAKRRACINRVTRAMRFAPQRISAPLTSAERNLKGSAGWNNAAVLPEKMAPLVSVSFFAGLPAVKSMSARFTQNTLGLRVDSK